MTRGKKVTFLVAVFLLAGMVAAGLAVGEAYQNSPFKRGPAYFLDKMDEKVKDLNLTPIQKQKFEETKSELRQTMESGHDEGREFFGRLKTEFKKDDPDMKAVAAMIKAQMGRVQDRVGTGIDRFVEFYGTLDGKQKDLVLARAREHMEKPKCLGRGGPWREKSE